MKWRFRVTETNNNNDDKVQELYETIILQLKNEDEITKLIRKLIDYQQTLNEVRKANLTVRQLTQKPKPTPKQQGMLKPPLLPQEPEVPEHLKKVWKEREQKAKLPI